MKRRNFIRNTSIAAAGLAIGCKASTKKPTPVESCSPENYAPQFIAAPPPATVQSVQNGDWSDPATWGGKVPGASDTVGVNTGHTVMVDADATCAGINIAAGAILGLSYTKTVILQSSKNIVVNGTLAMQTMAFHVGSTIRFVGVNEGAFVGGGMDVLESDIGLWVMGNGKLDIQGADKTAWTNLNSLANAGSPAFTVLDATGWNVGDEIVIAPTEAPNSTGSFLQGEERTIAAISYNTITLNAPLSKSHPSTQFNGQHKYAEVMNLTRNLRIEGTASGNSHIFIRSTVKQVISNVQMRFMGPRKNTGGGAELEFVPGRYGLHFHHCNEGSRGTLVAGCVVRDTNSHAFVPHRSNGVTFKNCVTYKTKEAAFWVDEGEATHSITYDNCIVGNVGFVSRSQSFEDPTSPTFGTHGILLGMGDDCKCNNCVVWGQQGTADDHGSFTWQANNEGVWEFLGNLAHNSMQGIWVWQNTTKNHIVDRFTAYNCGHGFLHGAYANSYTFKDCTFYACDVRFQANSAAAGLQLINSWIDVAGLHPYAIDSRFGRVDSDYPVQIIGCTLLGYTVAPLFDTNGADEGAWIKKMYDMVNCNFTGTPQVPAGATGEQVRVQNQSGDGKAYSVKPGNIKATIAQFAPLKYGTGTGLKGEYFNDSNWSGKVFERIDAPIAFQEWSYKSEPAGVKWIDYRITGNSHSMRWTGQIEAQYTEAYTFDLGHSGTCKLWIAGNLVTMPVVMVAGQRYDIKIEYSNADASSGVNLTWRSPSQVQQYVPQSQLYPSAGTVVIPPIIPPTDPPVKPAVTLTLSATATTVRVSANWQIKAVSSIGGKVNLKVTNSSGKVLASGDFDSGVVIPYGAGLARGTYTLTAVQGTVTKTMKLYKS